MVYRGCRAFRVTTDQAISDTTNTLIEFNGETFNITGFHSTTVNPSRMTIPDGYDGTYRVATLIRWEVDGTGYRTVRLLKNGVAITEAVHDADGTYATVMGISDTQTLEAGDYIEVQVYQTSGGSLDVLLNTAYTYFTIDLIGA